MIGKHIENPKTRSSFRALNDYITGRSKRRLEERGEKIAFSDCLNLASVNTATLEMEALAACNNRSDDPVLHLLLSWRENENPTREQVHEAVTITLDEMNISQCQALYSLHQNTDNLHLHICVNRIDPDTHKAVSAAHGWTRRGMERAARRIEAAQGWQVEQNTWSEVNERGEVVQKPISTETKISQRMKDKENLTGEQSAARKAQDALRDRVNDISSWDELHSIMHESGMEYRKKGSGAVILVGEVAIKASAASRNFTLKKLEKQLGPYRPPGEDMERNVTKMEGIAAPLPLAATNDDDRWREYIAARKEHYENKEQTREALKLTHKKARQELTDRHWAERTALFRSVRGKGLGRGHVNRQRSMLAARHAAEKATQKQEQKIEREKLHRISSSLKSYESWLRSKGLATEADAWRHRKNENLLELHAPEDFPTWEKNKNPGIPGFQMQATAQGVKFYRDAAETADHASFIDTGRRIRIYHQDDDTLLAAMQLAQEKWGGVQLEGTEDYKHRCAQIAAQNGIRIANPELRKITEKVKTTAKPSDAVQAEGESSANILWAKARRLAQEKLGVKNVIGTSAMENRKYEGIILGVVSHEGRSLAVQAVMENRVIFHNATNELPAFEVLVGKNAQVVCKDGYTSTIDDNLAIQNQRKGYRR